MSDLLEPGQIFAGRYRIEKFLAKGGFGAVYVAEQTETELRVAIKVLWAHVLHSVDAVEKFKLEARVAGRVGSEHIVRVFDAGFDEATKMPFLVMELLQGDDLEKVVDSRGPLPAETLVSYFRQIASALDKAHGYVDREGAARPIVHRDLKPENLFLCHRETGDPMVKVLDFGIAKVLSDSTKVSQEVKGTPLYMAFEQASAGRITPQTDIWALGLIGFYLLTGRCYWKTANLPEASLTQLFGEVLTLPIDPPSQRAQEIAAPVTPTAGFDAWFARCVHRDTTRRFTTAGECAVALHSALLGAPDTRLSPGAFMATAFAATAQAAVPSVNPIAATGVAPTTRSNESGSAVATTADSIALGRTKAPETKTARSTVIGLAIVGVLAVGGGATVLALRSGPTIAAEASASPAGQAASAAAAAQPAQPAATPPPPARTATVAPTLSAAPAAAAAPAADPRPATPPQPEHAGAGTTRAKSSTARAPTKEPAAKPATVAPTPAAAPGKTEVYGER
jgi:serine/threonine-protein kinase